MLGVALSLLLALTTSAYSETKVALRVTSDKSVENELKSLAGRELRSLGGVVVGDSDPDFELSLVAVTVENKAGEKLGIAISHLCLRSGPSLGLFETILKIRGVQDESVAKSIWEMFVEGTSTVCGHGLTTGGDDSLPKLVREIVAEFDVEVLEPVRKSVQEMNSKLRSGDSPTKTPGRKAEN